MFKKSIFCFCVFFIGSILIINSASALSLLSFELSIINVTEGGKDFFKIVFDPSEFGFLTEYNLLIQYNPHFIEINNDDITVISPYSDIFTDFLTEKSSSFSIDNVSGTIDIFWSSDETSFPGEDANPPDQLLTLAILGFTGRNEGTSDLAFLSIELFDEPLLEPSSPPAPAIDLNRYNIGEEAAIEEITANGIINVSAGTQSIPEPATFLLLGALLVGFCFFKRKEI